MSKLLEIFGRAVTVDTADLIWHWLGVMRNKQENYGTTLEGDDFDEIVDLLGKMELENATEKLKFYLFENPDCLLARMVSAAICLHNNDLAGAIEQAQSVYMRQPSNTMALYTLGYCYERLGQESEAIEFYQDCIKFKSHLQLPRQRMAAIYFKNGRLDKTISQYEHLTSEHPEDVSSLILLGYLYSADKQYEKAADTFNSAIVSHPDNFHEDDQHNDTSELVEAGRFEEAMERVTWLMGQVGEMPDLYVRMADIFSKAGRAAEAIENYENAIRIQPNYLEATIKLGTHYLRIQRPSLAAEQFNRAAEINDEIVDSYIGLAMAQGLLNQKDDAIKTLSLSSAIQQNSTLLFSETATLHLQNILNEEARLSNQAEPPAVMIEDVIKAHKEQIVSTPKSADIHYKFGILMMVQGNIPKAIEFFESALEINPTHYRSSSKLAVCLHDCGKNDLALESLMAMSLMDRDTLQLHYQTAILFCDKRRFADALASLENTLKQNYADPDAIVNIEVVLENLGLVDRAISTWDRLTETARFAIGARYQ
jgi:tetratricopeptide (TPR) repeat protein